MSSAESIINIINERTNSQCLQMDFMVLNATFGGERHVLKLGQDVTKTVFFKVQKTHISALLFQTVSTVAENVLQNHETSHVILTLLGCSYFPSFYLFNFDDEIFLSHFCNVVKTG